MSRTKKQPCSQQSRPATPDERQFLIGPLWLRPCPGGCEDAWCNLHGMHAFECSCPHLDEMDLDFNPYEER